MGQRIHIGTGFDVNYLNPLYALVGSLIEHHRDSPFELHAIVDDGVSAEVRRRIAERVESSGHRITLYKVDRSLVEKFVLSGKWTSVVYYRLFFSMLLSPSIERLLYMDCDTVAIQSLRPLYDIDLGDYPVGAVYDNYVKTQADIGITNEGEYFNSGVLVMDLARWREQQVSEKAFDFLVKYPERIKFVDQCALNAVLRNNWKRLDHRFNLMFSVLPQGAGRKQLREFVKDGVVVHFTLQRPWQMLCRNRLRDLYFHYLRRSGMADGKRSGYSDFAISKVPAWLKIRLHEWYFDTPLLRRLWRSVQGR